MIEKKEIANEKTILIGTIKPGDTDELIHEHLSELELLAETAGAEVIGKITQRISKINSATFIGKGKSMQIINQAIELNAKLIIFDDELSPAQIKNYYNLIMSSETNGLSELPNMVKFQLMTLLSFMWSIVFTLMIGSYLVLGPTMLLHVLFLIGIFFTSTVYRNSKSQ